MPEPLPRKTPSYESEYIRQKRERETHRRVPTNLLALLALENYGEPAQRYLHEPGEIDRGSYRHRLTVLQDKIRNSHFVTPSYLDDGWY